jgi:hypothetical protein
VGRGWQAVAQSWREGCVVSLEGAVFHRDFLPTFQILNRNSS